MSDLISPEYLDLQRELHTRGYGGRGDRWAQLVQDLMVEGKLLTVLDYGCGQGTLATALRNADRPCDEYDPAVSGKDVSPEGSYDLVVCTDVLEHVEPEHIDAVLDDLKRLAERAVLFSIALMPANKTLADGRNAHILLRPTEWWAAQILRRWKPVRHYEGWPKHYNVLCAARR